MRFRSMAVLVLGLASCNGGFGPERAPHSFFRSATRTTCEDASVVRYVNERSVDAQALEDAGVHPRGADNLIAQRRGPDGIEGTDDDQIFQSVAEVDAVPWIGEVSINAMYTFASRTCDFVIDPEFACMERTLIEWLSSGDTTVADIAAIGVHTRAAEELILRRDGPDGASATPDDQAFTSLDDVDSVPQVGGQTMADLLAWSLGQCQRSAEVVFSPQPYEQSHLVKVAAAIDGARRSIDIAMYSFSDAGIMEAIERARDREVQVRMVFNSASEDRRSPEGTRSARLEDMGVEVRWVNKVMHHKFTLIDGPRQHDLEAGRSLLITGSGNWSNGAGTRFDENTLFLEGDARLNLQFQAEFNLIWNNGRPVVWNEDIPRIESIAIEERMLAHAEGATAWFTSANFEAYQHTTYGPTFRQYDDGARVRDALVQLIDQADESVWIASGHLRTRQVFDALVRKRFSNPDIDIRVYLDGQEFVSDGYYDDESAEHAACLDAATDEGDLRQCLDKGYYFGAALYRAGIPIRYKYYAYRWSYTYADQMHHKYTIVDGDIVATGSYNLSPNAEFGTFENVVVLHSAQYREAVASFVNNFETIWETQRADDQAMFWSLIDEVATPGAEFPIVWTPMSLSHDEVAFLKEAVLEHCPEVDSDAYRSNPAAHRVCSR